MLLIAVLITIALSLLFSIPLTSKREALGMRGLFAEMVVLALIFTACGGGRNPSGNPTPPPAPSVSISPASLAFGDKAAGTSSAAQTVTLSNTGNASLAIGSILVSGDFQLNHNCGTNLAASANCTIQVTCRFKDAVVVRDLLVGCMDGVRALPREEPGSKGQLVFLSFQDYYAFDVASVQPRSTRRSSWFDRACEC